MPPRKRARPRDLTAKVADLGTGGQALWELLKKQTALQGPNGEMSSASTVLALEACRAVDRLDDLEEIIRGRRESQRLLHFAMEELTDSGDAVEISINVTVDNVLAEARQQQNALRAILATLGHGQLGSQKKGGGILDQLAARRAARDADRGAATKG